MYVNTGVKPKRYRYICLLKCFHEGMRYSPYKDTRKRVGFQTANANFQTPLPRQNVYIFDEEQAKRLPEGFFRRVD